MNNMNWVYVAYHEQNHCPIASSDNWESLLSMIDEYYGSDGKRLGWYPYDPKFPDSYQGHFEYLDFLDNNSIDKIKIYEVDFKGK
jgi:hypothetical protein